MINRLIVLTSFFVFCFINAIIAQEKSVTVKHTSDFVVTGDGSNTTWNTTQWHTITQRTSKELKANKWHISDERLNIQDAQLNTQFKILYSDKGIYCLFQCEDSLLTSTIKKDFGELYNEDVVEVFFWPDTARSIYFEYELSPYNYELPLVIFNNKGNINGWLPFKYRGNIRTTHAVNVSKPEANGRIRWTSEVFIPYTLLAAFTKTPPKKGMQWKANFYRIDYDKEPVYSSWQLTRGSYHDPEKFGTLVFE